MNKDKFLTEDEARQLENTLIRLFDKNIRDCLMLLIAMKTGCRATELLNLEKKDINTDSQSIFIKGIKNSNDCEIPLPQWLFERLVSYSKTISEEKLFPIGYQRLVQIWHQYRPVKKKFHSIRHLFAMTLYRKTRNIHLVKTALRHKSIHNTMVYMEHVTTEEDLKKALCD